MARILTGPLAAGISGKLGPVVFIQSKFGQLVQSAPRRVVHTSAPALASKDIFARANLTFSKISSPQRRNFELAGRRFGYSARAEFVGAALRAYYGGVQQSRHATFETDPWDTTTYIVNGNYWDFSTTKSPGNPPAELFIKIPLNAPVERYVGGASIPPIVKVYRLDSTDFILVGWQSVPTFIPPSPDKLVVWYGFWAKRITIP